MLLVAPTADPDAVGESALAYQWAERLSQRHEVTVLSYRQRHKAPLAGALPNARVVEWREPPLVGRNERFQCHAEPRLHSLLLACSSLDFVAPSRVIHSTLGTKSPVSLRYESPLATTQIPA